MTATFVPRHYLPDVERDKIAQYYFDLRARRITVTEVIRLSQRMMRVRFTGPDLEDFPTVAPEDHVKLFFDKDAGGAVRMPQLQNGRWSPAEYTFRDYTVRAFEPQGPFLDIDFVLHGHGVAGPWAARARPGDELGMLGPRGAFLVRDVCDWYVLASDETALPALARWVEGLRAGVPVTAVVEVQDAGDEIAIDTAADLDLRWLHRGDAEPGTTSLLEQAVRGLELPDGDGFVWVAGESMSIKPLRRYLSRELRLDRDSWDVDGYWRRGAANHDHHAEDDDEDDAAPQATS
ncbi:NADPH-dependent ferric siderophore reductase [Kineosphaera limosa]|uniref:Putative siderophore-interacting protein n=1 Tax=Kineosphaera limosa NBRC 100340 TaxID=1184609 RepID=K6WS72_9MICO|nr:siderophore-interacting protein [Kineosphaera limosa]NYE00868.1 NADPH-dependent ferric siderophore reductase [Kineosphaera limosa]GAB94937.1 putative siderophore-interacting protein [Kineosphaera limosa NBRC 100340]